MRIDRLVPDIERGERLVDRLFDAQQGTIDGRIVSGRNGAPAHLVGGRRRPESADIVLQTGDQRRVGAGAGQVCGHDLRGQFSGAGLDVVGQQPTLRGVGEPEHHLGDLGHVGPVDLPREHVLRVIGAVVGVGRRSAEGDGRHTRGLERPAVGPGALSGAHTGTERQQAGGVGDHPVGERRQIGRGRQRERGLVGEVVAVQEETDLARPTGMAVSDRIPGADAPVVVGVGVAELLAGVEHEAHGVVRPVVALHHRLGDGEVVGHARRIVGAGVEVGVVMGRQQHERAVLDRARQIAEDVVAGAAPGGHAHLLDQLHGGHGTGAVGVQPGLEPVAVLPGDVHEGVIAELPAAVERAEGVGSEGVIRVAVRAVGHDHADSAARGRFGGGVVGPEGIEVGIYQDELALHADAGGREGVVVGRHAVVDVDDGGRQAVRRRGRHARKGRGDQRAAAHPDARRLEAEDIDGDRLESYVAQPDVTHLLSQVQGPGGVGRGPRQTEAELRIGARHGRKVAVDCLWVAMCEDLPKGRVERGRGRRQRGRGQQQQDQQAQ